MTSERPTATIDGHTVTIDSPQTTILEAARKLDIAIPTLCYSPDTTHTPSCMLCTVYDHTSRRMLPACATPILPGMNITTRNPEIEQNRLTTLKLILSEHLGQCQAPCTTACPAHTDIPAINRLIARRHDQQAAHLIRAYLPLAMTLGHICPAPCTRACWRRHCDSPIAIPRLHSRIPQLKTSFPPFPPIQDELPSVAVIGGGPAGITCAYYLRHAGFPTTIYDAAEEPAAVLLQNVSPQIIAPDLIRHEIRSLLADQIPFIPNSPIPKRISWEKLRARHAIIVLLPGQNPPAEAAGLPPNKIHQLDDQPFHYAWIPRMKNPMTVRATAAAAQIATRIILQYPISSRSPLIQTLLTTHHEIPPVVRVPATHIPDALPHLLASPQLLEQPHHPAAGDPADEASACLQCACHAGTDCRIRRLHSILHQHPINITNPAPGAEHITRIEPAITIHQHRCIRCGICVAICRKHHLTEGFTFSRRGFQLHITTPFNRPFPADAMHVLRECVDQCPTRAILHQPSSQPDESRL